MGQSGLGGEIKKRRPFATTEEEVYLSLVRTADVLASEFSRLFKEHGLSDSLYNVLRILRGEGQPLPCLEIAARMVTREPDITRLIDRLETKGLVTRSRTEQDRRVVLVAVTPDGVALLGRLDRPVADLTKSLLGHLSPEEQGRLIALLDRARHPA